MRPGQLDRVGVVLCKRAGKPWLWTAAGPAPGAQTFADEAQPAPDGASNLLVGIAFDLRAGSGGARLGNVVWGLAPDDLRAVGSLLVALADGADALERWLTTQESPPARIVPRATLGAAHAFQRQARQVA